MIGLHAEFGPLFGKERPSQALVERLIYFTQAKGLAATRLWLGAGYLPPTLERRLLHVMRQETMDGAGDFGPFMAELVASLR